MTIYALNWLCKNYKVSDILSDAGYLMYIEVMIGSYVMAAGAISVQASYIFLKYLYKNEKFV